MKIREKVQEYLDLYGAIEKTDKVVPEPLAAAQLGISVDTLRRWAKRMGIRTPRAYNRRWIAKHDLERIRLRRKYHKYIRAFKKTTK